MSAEEINLRIRTADIADLTLKARDLVCKDEIVDLEAAVNLWALFVAGQAAALAALGRAADDPAIGEIVVTATRAGLQFHEDTQRIAETRRARKGRMQ